jgi:hypothetical protein
VGAGDGDGEALGLGEVWSTVFPTCGAQAPTTNSTAASASRRDHLPSSIPESTSLRCEV